MRPRCSSLTPLVRPARAVGARWCEAARRLPSVGWRPWRVLLVVALLPLLGVSAGAAPTSEPDEVESAPVALGEGVYEVAAGVFGTADDGLVGATTASGHVVQPNDRFVSLPACTVSACPWLAPGGEVDPEWGRQTSCAEGDGLCWVELTSATGACVTAPVLDVGPYFAKDNWWAPRAERVYDLERGVPAAEAAVDGADLGFGVGISDQGRDVRAIEQPYGLGIAAGTWQALGFNSDAGMQRPRVRLLWQAEVFQRDACGETAAGTRENATTTDEVNLRAQPSLDADVLTVVPGGRRVAVTGAPSGQFFPVAHGTQTGWVSGDYLVFDAGNRESLAFTTDDVNLRADPSFDAEIVDVLAPNSMVGTTGEEVDGFAEVIHDGIRGWLSAAYLATTTPAPNTAAATDDVNLRHGPSVDDPVLTVIPAGDRVRLTGEERDGFLGAEYGDDAGWVSEEYLTPTAAVDEGGFVSDLGERVDEAVVEPVADGVGEARETASSVVETVDEAVVEPVADGAGDAVDAVTAADDAVEGVVEEAASKL